MIYTVIPVKNQPIFTQNIIKQTKDTKIVILDNQSDCPQTQELFKNPELTVIGSTNKNIHQMWNKGIEVCLENSDCTTLAILNNDINLSPNCLDRCNQALCDVEKLVMCFPGNQIIGDEIRLVKLWEQYGKLLGVWNMLGYCMIIKARWLRETNYRFPEDMVYWCGDNDILMNVITTGYQAGCVGGCWVEHINKGGNTGKWGDLEKQKIIENDKKLFAKKWPYVGGFGNV